MTGFWSVLTIVTLVAVFVLAFGVGSVLPGQMSSENAAIAQPLVREGELALRLTEALNPSVASSEVNAESYLSSVGISPRNGWIADYPVTPDIAGELRSAVAAAGENGTISSGKDGGVKLFDSLMSEYNMAVTPDTSGQTANAGSSNIYPDDVAMDNYYTQEGPPIVTYYAPPYDYAYLYTWVPYPFWWWDVWFSGFFVLADFDRVVFSDGDHHRHGGHDRDGEHFSNHFFDERRNSIARVDAARRPVDKGFVTTGAAAFTGSNKRVWTGASNIVNSQTSTSGNKTLVPSRNGQSMLDPNRRGPAFSPGMRNSRSDNRVIHNGNTQGMGRAYGNYNYSSTRGRGFGGQTMTTTSSRAVMPSYSGGGGYRGSLNGGGTHSSGTVGHFFSGFGNGGGSFSRR